MALENPLLQFDSPRRFVNDVVNGGAVVQGATTCILGPGLVASRVPANPQPGEAQRVKLETSPSISAALAAQGYNPAVPYVDGGIIVFDLSQGGGMTTTTTAAGGAPTMSAINFTVGKTYRIDFLDLHGATVAWNSMFVVVAGEDNSTTGAFPELLTTVWDCLQTPNDGLRLYQRSGKIFNGVT